MTRKHKQGNINEIWTHINKKIYAHNYIHTNLHVTSLKNGGIIK